MSLDANFQLSNVLRGPGFLDSSLQHEWVAGTLS